MEDIGGQDRFPMLESGELDPEQQAVVSEIIAGPRGTFGGPFVPLLRSPQLLQQFQKVGEHLRFHSVAPDHLVEFVILLVARRWNQEFEWAIHSRLALAAGVDIEIVRAIADRRPPAEMDAGTEAAWRIFDELDTTTQVSDRTFNMARDALGEVVIVELISAMGYYTTLAMVMNAARTTPPASPVVPLS
jgi:4-carboxymuconolactone decarboxylase